MTHRQLHCAVQKEIVWIKQMRSVSIQHMDGQSFVFFISFYIISSCSLPVSYCPCHSDIQLYWISQPFHTDLHGVNNTGIDGEKGGNMCVRKRERGRKTDERRMEKSARKQLSWNTVHTLWLCSPRITAAWIGLLLSLLIAYCFLQSWWRSVVSTKRRASQEYQRKYKSLFSLPSVCQICKCVWDLLGCIRACVSYYTESVNIGAHRGGRKHFIRSANASNLLPSIYFMKSLTIAVMLCYCNTHTEKL